jgi:hypothetical protein
MAFLITIVLIATSMYLGMWTEGLVTKSNWLALMRSIGLDV